MRNFTRVLFAVIVTALFAACSTRDPASTPVPQPSNPYAPQPGDSAMMRGDLRIVSVSASAAPSGPKDLILRFDYFQPTPCYSLRVVPGQPDAQTQIQVRAYAVTEKDKACTLMALATPLHAELDLGGYPKGHYSVWLNGAKVGEVDL